MRFGAVLHDVGSSRLILSYLKDFTMELDLVLLGPSQSLVSEKPAISNVISLDQLLKNNYDIIFLSLNEHSEIDKKVMSHFGNAETLFFTFLDHWSFSANEFQYNDNLVLPDHFIVTDNYAESRARVMFPNSLITILENTYIEEFKNRFKSLNRLSSLNKILFLSEKVNVLKNPDFSKLYSCGTNCKLEFHAYDFFIRNIELFNINNPHIVIRPHPAQSVDDFGEEYFRSDLHISISCESELLNDFLNTKIAVGIHSIALLMAQEVGIKVFTCLPPGAGDIAIPGHRIPYLRDLKAKYT